MTKALQFLSFQQLLQNSGKKHVFFFNILFKSGSVAGEVKNQTLAFFPNICQQHGNFWEKNAYDPNIVFFLSGSCCKPLGKNMFFHIPFKSSSVAGEVWNQALTHFFANICHQNGNFWNKTPMAEALQFVSFEQLLQDNGKKHVFSTSPSKVAAWQVKYGTNVCHQNGIL